MPMNALVGRRIVWVSLALAVLPAWAKEPDVIYYSCRIKPSGEYMIRVDKIAEVMWVNGNRLPLAESDKEFRATEYSGELKEFKAEYRINRGSGALRRVSYNLNGAPVGAQEGLCKASDKPLPSTLLY
jgi:hypothetical protein